MQRKSVFGDDDLKGHYGRLPAEKKRDELCWKMLFGGTALQSLGAAISFVSLIGVWR